jgi:hypothetical protein
MILFVLSRLVRSVKFAAGYSGFKGRRCVEASGDIPLILGYQKSGATPTDSHAKLMDGSALLGTFWRG